MTMEKEGCRVPEGEHPITWEFVWSIIGRISILVLVVGSYWAMYRAGEYFGSERPQAKYVWIRTNSDNLQIFQNGRGHVEYEVTCKDGSVPRYNIIN